MSARKSTVSTEATRDSGLGIRGPESLRDSEFGIRDSQKGQGGGISSGAETPKPESRTPNPGVIPKPGAPRKRRSSKPQIEVAATLGPALHLLPYQRRWVEDTAQLKLAVKARQIGYSFAATLGAVLRCLERKTTWIFLSKGERQSRLLMEKVQEHIQSCGIVAQAYESTFFEGTMTRQLEARFPNGSVIYGLPANPDTARGYSGNVTLDEFAFHLDAAKVYAALYPSITRGYALEVISTPNGQQGKFFELAKDAGLADGEWGIGVRDSGIGIMRDAGLGTRGSQKSGDEGSSSGAETSNPEPRIPNPGSWSGHWCDIYKAAGEGLEIDLGRLRDGLDEDAWRQEFCCEFVAGGAEWIPAALYERCASAEASGFWDPESGILNPESVAVPGSEPAAGTPPLPPEPTLYAGWDIARHRDLSVIWLLEPVGDVTWTRGVIEMRDTPTPDQLQRARALMPFIRRMEIDQSGMGLAIVEALEREFPGKVEGVQFTALKKETLAVHARRRMEEAKVRLPEDEAVRQSFRSVRKSSNLLGQARFDAVHDSKYGHADHWWAFCLAEAAAGGARPVYAFAELARVVGRPMTSGPDLAPWPEFGEPGAAWAGPWPGGE
ncbi:MAG TPA: terminase family protein [Terriglobia bacterium]|nr:terminase family protein [Terriglobia bacterium]